MSESVPDSWAMGTVGEITAVNPRLPVEPADITTVGFVPMAAVCEVTGAITKPEERPYGKVKRGYTPMCDGDVIFAKITPCMENGKSAIVRDLPGGVGCGSTEFFVMRPEQGVLPEWVHRFVRQASYRQLASEQMNGAVGQARVPRDFLEQSEIPVASEAEQRRIVAKLDALQSRTRLAREALVAIPALLDHYRQSVLAAAFRGDLTSSWRDANKLHVSANEALLASKANVVETKRLHQLVRRSSEGATDTPPPEEIPTSWCAKTVRELVQSGAVIDFQDGNHGSLYPRKSEFGSTGILFLTATQIVDGVVRLSEAPRLNTNKAKELRIGYSISRDVLLTHNATVGRVAIMPTVDEPVILGTSVTYYRCNDVVLLPEYLKLFFCGHYWQSQMQSVMEQTTRDQVSVNKQVEFTVIVPPIAEQIEIVRRVSDLFCHLSVVIDSTRGLRTGVDHLDQSLLATAFRGELVPQDPADEPASVLLDRIRAARAQASDAPRTRRPRTPAAASPPTRAAEPATPYRAATATLLAALRTQGSLASFDAQAATGLDAAGVRPLLQRLVSEGAAKVEGQKRGTRYVACKGG